MEFAPQLGSGETADVRLAPLQPEQWQHLKPGDVITMHEAQPAAGIAEIIEILPPRACSDLVVPSSGSVGNYSGASSVADGRMASMMITRKAHAA
ncbi:hypothetical protein [Streptomyces sp. NPDC006691]|uniref:hypothetical protein n=1 Tax=Streptomyces sp. NPDC006691 TaxID=3364757 RepID=UPI0036AB8FF0